MSEAQLAPPPLRAVARVTIELTAPLSIGTGKPGDFEDDLFVTDANGLPAIPATSLAGRLRAELARRDATRAEALFGYVKGSGEGVETRRSRLLFSWGHVHGADDRPVESLMPSPAVAADPVLAHARAGMLRDHVRLDHFGVVHDRGKFDRTSVAAGHRFTFEVEWEGDRGEASPLDELLAVLADPAVRLGGHTRMGLGAFRLVRAAQASFDLAKQDDFAAYGDLPAELRAPAPALKPVDVTRLGGARLAEQERWRIVLRPREPWVVGGSDPEWEALPGAGDDDRQKKAPDLVPYREARVRWSKGAGAVGAPEYVVPATALKGALRHRVAFALRARTKQWAPKVAEAPRDRDGAVLDPPELAALFGEINRERVGSDGRVDADERGRPGRLFLSDGRVEGKVQRRRAAHVSLDRFTGAPMKGLLFEDEALEGGAVHFDLVIDRGGEDERGAAAYAALMEVFEDLRDGMLQLGAGYGRGYGWFEGSATREGA